MKGFLILIVPVLFSVAAFGQQDRSVPNKSNPILNAEIISRDNRELHIRVQLVNFSSDTLYYLSGSCGDWHDLNFDIDTNVFAVLGGTCDSSYPVKLRILPKDSTIDSVNLLLLAYPETGDMEAKINSSKPKLSDVEIIEKYKGMRFKVSFHWQRIKNSQIIKKETDAEYDDEISRIRVSDQYIESNTMQIR
jgi:hypothetical protein